MNVLVVNAGSSSLKYQLLDTDTRKVFAKGNCERIGSDMGIFGHSENGGAKQTEEVPFPDHRSAIARGLEELEKTDFTIDGIGHRIVQGGWHFDDSAVVDDEVMAKILEVAPLAPLHNYGEAAAIEYCREKYPELPNVAVFDTSFHMTMPEVAYTYALPKDVCDKYHVRKYGAHGTSHRYVSRRACEFLGLDYEKQRIITCHIGNGASITAIADGKSIDTSMGLTPTEGLMMGTRVGDVDPGALVYLMEQEGLDAKGLSNLINKRSGVAGITEGSSDMRDVEDAIARGDERAKLAMDMYEYRILKYIGAYAAVLGGVDVIVFTAGVGENQISTREAICKKLAFMGVTFNAEANRKRGQEVEISGPDSKIHVVVIPTDEELMIAKDTAEIVERL